MSIFAKPQGDGEEKKKTIIIKKPAKADDKEKKIVSSGSIWSGTDSFFGWLGFKKKVETVKTKVTPIKEKEDIEAQKKEQEKIASDEFFEQASQIAKKNAVVVRSAEPTTRPSPGNRPQGNRPQGNRWGNTSAAPRPGGRTNVSFGQGHYKDRPRKNAYNTTYNNTPVTNKSKEVIVQKPKIIKEAAVSDSLVKKENIIIKDIISVKEFSEKSWIPFSQILKFMLTNKIMGGINTALDFDTVSLIALEFGVNVVKEQQTLDLDKVMAGDLNAILEQDKTAENTLSRAPIVTVMGHVDHGKTSLLDYLRKTTVAGGESGGITQSIGASKIKYNGNDITFIDTPGHELFTNLRSRGAKVTNIVVIVIAADDGLKPQTIESINHAKEAGVPIIIALTKIDKPDTKIEQIKSDVGNYGLIPEDWGGDVPLIGVSSKTGEGMDKLLEQILFQSEVLDLKYDPKRSAVGVIIDAHKDAKQGILTSIIVLTGTLKVGDIVVVHNTSGKIRKMINSAGQAIRVASGGEPVQILGINQVPEPGRVIEVVANEKEAHRRIDGINDSMEKSSVSTLWSFLEQMKKNDGAVLKIVCKANGPSSLEAMKQALTNIPLPKNVSFKIIHSGLGDISESDIGLAQVSEGIVLGYNVICSALLKKRAENAKVSVKLFDIIYALTDYIEQVMKDMVEKEYREVERGKLEVLGVFFRKDKTMIIGGKVIEGKVGNGMKFRVENLEKAPETEQAEEGEHIEKVISGEITSLQRESNSVKEVSEGYECGMKIRVSKKITEGMILTFYEMEEIIDND